MKVQNLNTEEVELLHIELLNSKKYRAKQLRIGILEIILGIFFGFIFLKLSDQSEFASKMMGISFATTGFGILVWIYWKNKIDSISKLASDINSGKKILGTSQIIKIPSFGKLAQLEDGTMINQSDLTFMKKPKVGDSVAYERTLSGEYYFELKNG